LPTASDFGWQALTTNMIATVRSMAMGHPWRVDRSRRTDCETRQLAPAMATKANYLDSRHRLESSPSADNHAHMYRGFAPRYSVPRWQIPGARSSRMMAASTWARLESVPLPGTVDRASGEIVQRRVRRRPAVPRRIGVAPRHYYTQPPVSLSLAMRQLVSCALPGYSTTAVLALSVLQPATWQRT